MKGLKAMLRTVGIKTAEGVSLSSHSSFRIGGEATLVAFPNCREELLKALRFATERRITPVVIGKGSNVVFPDEGLDRFVIFTDRVAEVRVSGETVYADAGATLSAVAIAARDASLTGAEFLYGIPGTLGGGVFMNAGAFGGSMSDICTRSEYYHSVSGEFGTFEGAAQDFAYRTSRYANDPFYTVLGAALKLTRGERDRIDAKMQELMTRRRTTQPLKLPSAGSVFKRPEGYFAGKLIEDCGLKGVRVGGAEVSELHAGFIVNRGGATASDVRALVALIQERVMAETGVALECEIRFL